MNPWVWRGIVGGVSLTLLYIVYQVGVHNIPLPDARAITRPLPPPGTYQYVHLDGPLMLAWDTRTGAYKFCLVRPAEQGMILDCGLP